MPIVPGARAAFRLRLAAVPVVLSPRDFVKTPTYFGPAPREIRNRQNIWQAKPGEKAVV